MRTHARNLPVELAMVGDLSNVGGELTSKLLEVPPLGECILYIDSPGGSPYAGMSLMSLIRLRGLRATAIVTGECSSAALWPFAACTHRLVTRCSVMLFHPMRWHSEENVGLAEASEWARHFGQLEGEMDDLLADLLNMPAEKLSEWTRPGRYVSGREMAEAGLAELVELSTLDGFQSNGLAGRRRRARTTR